jgi:hypothetical protein
MGADLRVSLAIVGEILGHPQPSTTKRYAHLANRVVREALEHTAGIIAAATNMPSALPVAPFEPLRDVQWAAIVTLVDADRPRGGKRWSCGMSWTASAGCSTRRRTGRTSRRPTQLYDVLAPVQALLRGRDLAQGRGPAGGAGGPVRASPDTAGAASAAREPYPAKVPHDRSRLPYAP